jgi:LexA-binding, inner membrane-associated putative hydrolase
MSPITHLLASWSMADMLRLRARDLTLSTLCGILPDADGLGLVVDGANRVLGRPDAWYYDRYHHAILHGLPAAVAIPLALSLFAVRRSRMFVVGLVAVHLHFLCDVLGSRGPGADDIWPLPYLAPFSDRLTIRWSGQWPLTAWPNVVFTISLLGFAFFRAIASGYSPLGVFSSRADRAFVTTVRHRWDRIRRTWSRREA